VPRSSINVGGAAFQKFLRLARDQSAIRVTVGGAEQLIAAILAWGIISPEGRRAAMESYGFADVLSVADMLSDLAERQPREWAEWVGIRRRWTDDLFEWLAYPPITVSRWGGNRHRELAAPLPEAGRPRPGCPGNHARPNPGRRVR
jgi:hypothetical protein